MMDSAQPTEAANARGIRASNAHAARRALILRPQFALPLALLIALTVNWRSLSLGWFGDDYVHMRFALQQLHGEASDRASWNLFDDRRAPGAAIDGHETLFGPLPWWTSPSFSFALLRPLSAWSQLLDYALWPNSPMLMHLHNIALFGVILFIAGALYRRWLGLGVAFWIAVVFYAIDDSHSIGTAWIASRNTLLATLFGLSTLWAFDSHARWTRWLAPLFLLCAHASAEGSIAIWAYLVAYVLFLDRRTLRERAIALGPLAAVSFGWFLLSAGLGYGVRGSSLYIDPRADPQRFLLTAITRLPEIVRLQLGISDAALRGLALSEQPALGIASYSLILLALVFGLRSSWRTPVTRFFLLGTALALIPQCSIGALERLMYLSGFGAHGLLGLAAAGCIRELRAGPEWKRAAYGCMAAAVFAIHGVVALIVPPLGFTFAMDMHAHVWAASRTLPRGPEVADRSIMVLNYPNYLMSVFLGVYRQQFAWPGPHIMHVLSTSPTPVRITRSAPDRLELQPIGGYFMDASMWVVRKPGERFNAGETVQLADAQVEVVDTTPDGRPAKIAIRARLDDPRLLWVAWNFKEGRFVLIDIPPVGFNQWLPSTVN
jgi:hypothetical protein